jgi:ribosomal protein S17
MNINLGTHSSSGTKEGVVVGVFSDGKTAKVCLERVVVDSLYGKRQKKSLVVLADIGGLDVKDGSKVTLGPTRRLSKHKTWKLLSVKF